MKEMTRKRRQRAKLIWRPGNWVAVSYVEGPTMELSACCELWDVEARVKVATVLHWPHPQGRGDRWITRWWHPRQGVGWLTTEVDARRTAESYTGSAHGEDLQDRRGARRGRRRL